MSRRIHLRTSRGIACGIGHRDTQLTSTTDPARVTCRGCLKTSIHAAVEAAARAQPPAEAGIRHQEQQ